MNRNVESHFSELPKIDIERSIFDRSSSHKTSFNVGQLIPFYVDEVIPGDTFNVTTSCVVRLQTPLTPIMDNIYLDTYFFFVPNRIVWTHWKEFMGESKNAWIPNTEYSIPKIVPPDEGWQVGTLADYLGIPVGVGVNDIPDNPIVMSMMPTHLPFRGYCMIADQFFRDQNLQTPLNFNTGDATVKGENTTDFPEAYVVDCNKGGQPFVVAKYHDYFTSCLPGPMKGPEIKLLSQRSGFGVGSFIDNQSVFAPVITRSQQSISSFDYGVAFRNTDNQRAAMRGNFSTGEVVVRNDSQGLPAIVPDNLWADLSQANLSINDLRIAFQLQKFYEKSARAGTRYREILREHFGVTSSDARMQIPEYLGGHRFPLSIHQVTNQTSGETEFLGDLGAMSNTSDVHEDFVKSFEEHGFVFGLCCVRYDHSYPQGLEKFWMRNRMTDFYFPVFANIGEQPVYKSEIMWSPNNMSTAAVFGYQEAWADYRYKPSRVSGEMRPGVTNSLATWHLADYYQNVPSLSYSWIQEDKSNVDRVLSVTSSVANQVFADFYVKNIVTRPMPMYSIPGLIDHH